MPVADALADAETLRLNSRNPGYGPTTYRALRMAEEQSFWLTQTLACPCAALPFGGCEPHVYARQAARAAFRAVPGLREAR